jgi:serine/threonine protein phosphatase PrpC
MNSLPWKFAFASVIGTSHITAAKSCQDKSECCVLESASYPTWLAAIVADGAGSASNAEVGASLACSLFIQEVNDLFWTDGQIRDITRKFAQDWLTRFQNEVTIRAYAEQIAPREFACTVLAAVIGEDCAAFFQVGDGAIVVTSEEPEEYCWVFWPDKGEYENVTTFATEPSARDRMQHEIVDHRIDELAMFSDGLQRLVLDFKNRTVPSPFFRSMFKPLQATTTGYSEKISEDLVKFLGSSRINDRTDDDKTLILASRCERPPQILEPPIQPPSDHEYQKSSL